MAAALDADGQTARQPEIYCRHDVGRARAARDERGTVIDHAVPDGPCLVVLGFTGAQERTVKACTQLLDAGIINLTRGCPCQLLCHASVSFRGPVPLGVRPLYHRNRALSPPTPSTGVTQDFSTGW